MINNTIAAFCCVLLKFEKELEAFYGPTDSFEAKLATLRLPQATPRKIRRLLKLFLAIAESQVAR